MRGDHAEDDASYYQSQQEPIREQEALGLVNLYRVACGETSGPLGASGTVYLQFKRAIIGSGKRRESDKIVELLPHDGFRGRVP